MKKIEPYLFANGRADEMLAFYKDALGAELLMRMTYSEGPQDSGYPLPPDWGVKVMHSALKVGDLQLMISDGDSATPANFDGFRLSLTSDDEATLRRAFDALSAGGSVQMPLSQTFFTPLFGMLTDKFGIGWMINLVA